MSRDPLGRHGTVGRVQLPQPVTPPADMQPPAADPQSSVPSASTPAPAPQRRLLVVTATCSVGALLLTALLLGLRQPPGQTATAAAPRTQGVPSRQPAALPAAAQEPLRFLPLDQLTPGLVTQVEGGAFPVLHFRDGSQRSINSFEIQQLPGEIRIQLEYQRNER